MGGSCYFWLLLSEAVLWLLSKKISHNCQQILQVMFQCKFLQTVLPPLSKQEHTLLMWFYKVVDYLHNIFFFAGQGRRTCCCVCHSKLLEYWLYLILQVFWKASICIEAGKFSCKLFSCTVALFEYKLELVSVSKYSAVLDSTGYVEQGELI